MDTNHLIQRLAEQPGFVRPLAAPSMRATIWLALAMPYMALVVLVVSPRSDLAAVALDTRFAAEQAAALATGVAAAITAFASTIPGFNRKLLLLPAAPMVVWLGSLGQGCVQAWMQFGWDGLAIRPDWICFPAIVLVGVGPAITMAVMLRRGAPLTPHISTALGGLAAAGIGNFGLRLFHTQDASIMVLVWQMGTVIALSALAGSAGRHLLSWQSMTRKLRQSTAAA